MELLVQKYLREGGTLESLKETFAVSSRRGTRYPNLVLLKYNQIESPMGDPLVQECRGLILDSEDDWRVVCFPFKKFFNHGEANAATIDWAAANVFEKLDGSMMTLYNYRSYWNVSTSGVPDAQCTVGSEGMTFSDLFWETWNSLGLSLDSLDPSTCYMFELMTPENRVVIPHSKRNLVLIGARGLGTFQEFHPEVVGQYERLPYVRSFSLKSVEDVMAAAATLGGLDQEGFVVCDYAYNRVKIKSPKYVAFHHLKDSLSSKRMADIVRANEGDEFLTYFPEMRPLFEGIKARYEDLVWQVESVWNQNRHIEDRKEFAMMVKGRAWSPILFDMKSGRSTNVREYLAKARPQHAYDLLGV
jgi:hypothetical protein